MEPNNHSMPNADLKARVIQSVTKSFLEYYNRYKQIMSNHNTGEQIDVTPGRASISVMRADADCVSIGDVLAYGNGRLRITGSGRVLRGFVFFPTQRITRPLLYSCFD